MTTKYNTSNFIDICNSKNQFLTEDSIRDVNLKLLGDTALKKVAVMRNAKNFKFLISHGVKINYVKHFDDYTELGDVMELVDINEFYEIITDVKDSKVDSFKVLVKAWKTHKNHVKWESLTNDIANELFIHAKLLCLDIFIDELKILPDGNKITVIGVEYTDTFGGSIQLCKTMILDYCLKGKIAHPNIDFIINKILTLEPKFIEVVFELIETAKIQIDKPNGVKRETLLKHFMIALVSEFDYPEHNYKLSNINEVHTLSPVKTIDMNSLSSDLINIYLKHGFSKSDVKPEDVIRDINMNIRLFVGFNMAFKEKCDSAKIDETVYNTPPRQHEQYNDNDLSKFNGSIKKFLGNE